MIYSRHSAISDMQLNPLQSWTLSFIREHASLMTLNSVWRYRNHGIRAQREQVKSGSLIGLKMRPPVDQVIYLRELGSDDLTFREIFLDDVYGDVVRRVPSCQTMIDLGANIGLASVYFMSRYNCRVFAVEPNPSTFSVLEKNLSQRPGAACLQGAVWSHAANLGGNQSAGADHFSMFSTEESSDGEIQGYPLPEVIRRSGFAQVDLLKVDVEGAERELFKGPLDWLRSIRAIAIEFHDSSRDDIGFDRIMAEHGFQIEAEGGHTVVATRPVKP